MSGGKPIENGGDAKGPSAADVGGSLGEPLDRRSALSSGTTLLMLGGLIGGYGTFFAMAARYFFPTGRDTAWMFVASADAIQPGDSLDFESPAGEKVVITRRADVEDAVDGPSAESFLALSSICPHLGCRVHWEAQNDRFFCPCHNGVFSPDGIATAGPPATAGQHLPRYPLMVDNGALYIEMRYRTI